MPQEVQVGTILMSECPQFLGLESEPYSGTGEWSRRSMDLLLIARFVPQDGISSLSRRK
jgi:hypothetical protein